MMRFCAILNGTISNIIVGPNNVAAMGLLGYYPAGPGARIGEPYVYPDPLPEPEPEFGTIDDLDVSSEQAERELLEVLGDEISADDALKVLEEVLL